MFTRLATLARTLTALVAGLCCVAALADTIPDPPSHVYYQATTKIPIPWTFHQQITSLSDGVVTVEFFDAQGAPAPMRILTVPWAWEGWGEPPKVEEAQTWILHTEVFSQIYMRLTSTEPIATFGFEAEQNDFAAWNFNVQFWDRDGDNVVQTINRDLDGVTAHLLAASYPRGIGGVTIMTSPGVDFAMGQFRYRLNTPAPVPEPATLVLLGGGLLLAARKLR